MNPTINRANKCEEHTCMYYHMNEKYHPKKQPKGMNLSVILKKGGIIIQKNKI